MGKVLEVDHLTKKYGKNAALDGLHMEIEAGSIYGLVGNNGAGKTTLMRVVMGLAKESAGDYLLFGKKRENLSARERRNVSAVIEMPTFYPHMTGYQNLKIHQMEIGDKVDRQKILEILEKVDMLEAANKKVRTYSLGMKQRLGIARALLSDSEFIILDEPTNGLDPAAIIGLRKLILDLNKNQGKTFLISSHHIVELTQVIDKLGIIKKGKMVQEISYDELKKSGENIEEYIMQLA